VNPLTWIYVVQFVASCASLFWGPAKDASVPNLVPPDQLEQANQYSLFTTFGTAPIAGIIFSLLSLVSRALEGLSHYFSTNPVNLALYFNTATFVVSALTIYALHEIPKRQFSAHISAPSVAKTIWHGWRFIGRTQVVRGLVIGMVGFAGGGVVVDSASRTSTTRARRQRELGRVLPAILRWGWPGMFLGLRILNGFSPPGDFRLSIVSAAIARSSR
jgi:dTMP kinase